MSADSVPEQPSGGATLAQRQAALVRALVAGAPIPPGFDAEAVGAAADALLRKRAGEVARRYPLLVHACQGEFTARFTAWARSHPKTTTPADAAAFAAATGIDCKAISLRRARTRWWFPWHRASADSTP
ncbi:hypothetical protein [Nocardia araoensis]|uniref:hypothetical protein n=1 Tax=Nocardia araoensis TaxID=228600 RepID=UPI0002FB3EB6|nr:hypothetical protein [Nocardia araoensis]